LKNEYFDSDSFKELLNNYERSVENGEVLYLDPEDFADLADYYLTHDKPTLALKCIDAGLAIHMDDEDLLAVKSSACIFFHRYDEAEAILNRLPQTEIGSTYYQRAQIQYAKYGKVELAEEMFQEWMDNDTKECEFSDDHEREDVARDNFIHVISTFVELADDHDYDPEVVKRWIEEYLVKFSPIGEYDADLILCDIVREEGMTDMIEKVYAAVLETNPYINMGWSVLAGAQNANGHVDKAIESCEFALAINPNDYDAMLSMAFSHYYSNRRVEALPWIEKYIEGTGDDSQFFPLGMCLMAAERLPEAIEALDKALDYYHSIKETQPEVYQQAIREISEAYYGCECNEKALLCIDEALSLSPNDPDCLLMRGSILMSMNMMEDCVASYTDCLKNANDKIWYTMGIAARFTLNNQPDVALELLDTVDDYTENTESLQYLPAYRAFAYFHKQMPTEYLDNLKLACEQCPDCIEMLMLDYFPPTVRPQDYYSFTIERIEKALREKQEGDKQ